MPKSLSVLLTSATTRRAPPHDEAGPPSYYLPIPGVIDLNHKPHIVEDTRRLASRCTYSFHVRVLEQRACTLLVG